MQKKLIKRIDNDTLRRYNKRLEKFGDDPKSLGWDTKKSQTVRFNAALSLVDVSSKNILDIGCGFGDFLDSVYASNKRPAGYFGIDINDNLLEIAREKHPEAHFENVNLLLTPFKKKYNLVFMNGILNFNLKSRGIKNYDYAQEFIKKAWMACEGSLVVDMLSSYLAPGYKKEGFVFYYSPEKMFSFAQTLTSNVTLKHDYPPIPQREFMLLIKR